MKSRSFRTLAFLLAAAVLTAIFVHRPAHYPYVLAEAPDDLKLVFLRQARVDPLSCRNAVSTLAGVIRAACPGCRIAEQLCLTELTSDQRALLAGHVIPFPSSPIRDGYILYSAADPATALEACREAEKQTIGLHANRVLCYAPNITRSLVVPNDFASKLGNALVLLLLSAIAALFVGYLVVRYEALHSRWSLDSCYGPQKFHSAPTCRIGGLCLITSLFVAGAFLLAADQRPDHELFGYLLLASLPAFLGGITEDVTKSVAVASRLMLTMIAASLGAWLLGASLDRLAMPGLDALLRWAPFAVFFTVFAVGGVANAINIIDGYNGLAAGYAVIVLASLSYVCAQLGDVFLLSAALSMLGALLGFLFWNYPKGRLFLGDGGAYLLGFWIAEISVLLVVRHPQVSPWFPLALLIYPVFETLYSIYRRKMMRGGSPGRADRLHLHQLIYMRLVKKFVGSVSPELVTRRNSMVAPHIWVVTACFAAPATVFWQHTGALAALCIIYCGAYLWLYGRIVAWRVPAWLVRREIGR